MLEAIGKRMGLSEETIRAYEQTFRRKPNSKSLPEGIHSFDFDLDTFQLLSVWYHFAILELIRVQGFKTDSRWIAKTLGIGVEEVNVALQRLLRLGILEMSGRHRWIDQSGDAEFTSAALTEAARNQINQELYELASVATKHIPSQHRVHRQMTVAVDSRRLSRFSKLADEFMNELRSVVSEGDSEDDVYQAEISFFPVTTLKRKRGEKNG
jgi:uncharacterized protein (TIGR02147 family)